MQEAAPIFLPDNAPTMVDLQPIINRYCFACRARSDLFAGVEEADKASDGLTRSLEREARNLRVMRRGACDLLNARDVIRAREYKAHRFVNLRKRALPDNNSSLSRATNYGQSLAACISYKKIYLFGTWSPRTFVRTFLSRYWILLSIIRLFRALRFPHSADLCAHLKARATFSTRFRKNLILEAR